MKYFSFVTGQTQFEFLSEAPKLRLGASVTNYKDKYIVVIGGHLPTGVELVHANVDIYNIEKDSWES